MGDWAQAEDLAGKLTPVGAAFGFVLGLAAACFGAATKRISVGLFFGIWLGAVTLGGGAGAALGIGLVALGSR